MSLMKRFYNDRYLHIRVFSMQLAITWTACAALIAFHNPEFYHLHLSWFDLGLIPLGIYVGGVSAVFIHNATHNSFPSKWLNETCGYIAGIHQLWGFMGWRLIHLVHHQYSDNLDMDPHPPGDLTFVQFTRQMFYASSRTISKRYREHWGENAQTYRLQKIVTILFPLMAFSNVLFWFLLLGPAVFVFFYIPSFISNHLLFVGVNYTAHPKDPVTGESKAANLNETLFHKCANFFWFGIYFHGNHHRRPQYFNPRHMPANAPRVRNDDDAELAA